MAIQMSLLEKITQPLVHSALPWILKEFSKWVTAFPAAYSLAGELERK